MLERKNFKWWQKSRELERRRGCFILTFIFTEKYIQEILQWKKKKKLSQLKILRQPASADFWVVSTCCFKFIQQKVENLLQKKVERTQKSAEAGCLKILSCLYFFFDKCRWYRWYSDGSINDTANVQIKTLTQGLSLYSVQYQLFHIWKSVLSAIKAYFFV